MLVTFSSPVYADITLFGDIAVLLLKLMGHSATIPSALDVDDVPAALARLEAAVAADKKSPTPVEAVEGEDDEAVSLSHRALPLIEMLKAAKKAKSHVMWDSNTRESAE